MTNLWGIDLGGTKLEGVVLNSQNLLEPLCRLRVDTEAQHGYAHILGQIEKLVALMQEHVGSSASQIGFATPGVLDPKLSTMKNCNTTCLNGQSLLSDLEKKLGLSVRLANDANCFALAEARMGAGRGAKNVFGVIMGTGVGGGVVLNGQALTGLQGIAGEWGHNVLDANGPDCYCGKKGCVEKIISGPATESYYQQQSGKALRLKEIVALHRSGNDPIATQTIERLATYFGRAITVVINILDPDAVVLGGGLSNIAELYSIGIEEAKRNIFNNRLETPIVQNQLGDSAGVFGAALLFSDNT
ncbi:MAG: ROK family protein [Deltaproteobacteria bacterium]|nr:ROK family protein [Deltaproteobacteria bacterium]